MNPLFENDHPIKSSVERFESNHADFNAKDPKHEGKICDYFNEYIDRLEANYNCDEYDLEDIQYYLDETADYYGCGLELCGLTAGAEQVATTSAPLFLTLLFWLFK